MKECPIVETSLGKVKGRLEPKIDDGKQVYLYTKLPFAKPPVGDLRFEPPVEPEPWNGVLDASQRSLWPPQITESLDELENFLPTPKKSARELSEDCLYLSVYTPHPSKDANLPVMFWIYGGGFACGGEAPYDMSVLASLNDVVVVVPNYRVSVFGFFSLGQDTNYSGNAGLLDQQMALKWIQNHIRSFGGNPGNVTIFGESAGAMSVNYHVISPTSKGLFHKAISHSGSMYFSSFPLKDNSRALNLMLEELKITEKNPDKLVQILKSLPLDNILTAVKDLLPKLVLFSPVIDGKFFPKDVDSLAKEKVANPVPYVIGYNNTEVAGILASQFPKDFSKGISKDTCLESLKLYLNSFLLSGFSDSTLEFIMDKYEEKEKTDEVTKWSQIYAEILGDAMFVVPAMKSLRQHIASKASTYMYLMTQTPKYNHDLECGPEKAMKASFCQCDHADDLVFTTGLPLSPLELDFNVKFTEEEKELSKEWMKYLSNFAKNGDPNIGAPVKVKWPLYNAKDEEYLSVQHPCSTGTNYKNDVFKFWKEDLKVMQNKTKGEETKS